MVKTDLVRLDSLLPELSPRDRGSELVEHTVRQHVSLCFAALERRLLATVDALSAALAGAGGAPPRGGNGGGAEARRRLVAQGLALLQALLVQGLERLLRRWAWFAGGLNCGCLRLKKTQGLMPDVGCWEAALFWESTPPPYCILARQPKPHLPAPPPACFALCSLTGNPCLGRNLFLRAVPATCHCWHTHSLLPPLRPLQLSSA